MTDKKAGLSDLIEDSQRPFIFNTPVSPNLRSLVETVLSSNLKMYVVVAIFDEGSDLFFNPSDAIDYQMCRCFFVKNEAESWRKTMAILNPGLKLRVFDAHFDELYPVFTKALTSSMSDLKIVLSVEDKKDMLDIETWTRKTFLYLN